MPYKTPYPPVRISPIAHDRLQQIVAAIKSTGLRISGASYLTSLILAQPIPPMNGNGSHPPAEPCEEQKEG